MEIVILSENINQGRTMKIISVVGVLFSFAFFSVSSSAGDLTKEIVSSGGYSLYQRGNGIADDIIYANNNEAWRLHQKWWFRSIGGGKYQIRADSRKEICIYDPKRSDLAKYDSSCNENWARNEWSLTAMGTNSTGTYYRISNYLGKCMEVDPIRNRVKVLWCDSSKAYQRFYLR